MTGNWSERLWAPAQDTYAAILAHPFLAGLTDGSLPRARFAYYLAQDVHYLRDYARALALVGARAPNHHIGAMFATHAAEAVAAELALHEQILPQLGVDPAALDAIPASPTTTAYTSYLLATGYGSGFADGLAAVLPCYWIYQRVGDTLAGQGSPDRLYQRWIDTYAGDRFAATVDAVLAVVNETGPGLSDEDRRRAGRHFCTTARYEWMFWDAAWRQEAWPI
ncbi:MAG: thiaminase II [Jatrophihabitans sp.]|nr:MAG: thiaminase II [Jatrophihabitans sp.]